ncbi:MAG: energy transducer TonB [Ferruginibacter sp.]|nr:energy transducer TonB [Ferruginibacter sp.]
MKHLTSLFLFFCFSTISNAQNVPPLPSDSTENVIFSQVEQEAVFPGGDEGWRQYLIKNLHPERIADLVKFPRGKKVFKQTVIVKFIVSRDGTLWEVTAENYKEVDPYCAASAISVVKKSPNWIPAFQNGRKVNAYRRQPITFVFE